MHPSAVVFSSPNLIESHQLQSLRSLLVRWRLQAKHLPHCFRGLGMDGLQPFHRICRAKCIQIIAEVMDAAQIRDLFESANSCKVGARISRNVHLLDKLGMVDKPVMLKRGVSGRSRWHYRRDSRETRASRHRRTAGLGLCAICGSDEKDEGG
jgi:hypothetical protein